MTPKPTQCVHDSTFRKPSLVLLATLAMAIPAAAVDRTYQYYRFTEMGLSDDTITLTQISEFRFFHDDSPVDLSGVTVTNPDGDTPDAEGPENLVDGDLATKWLDFNREAVIFDFGEATTVDAYDWATANDAPGRDPVSWTLEGSDNGTDWDLIDDRREVPVARGRQVYISTYLGGPFPLEPVIIAEFGTTQNLGIVENGDTVELGWDTFLSDSLTLDPGGSGPLNESDFLTVTPPNDSTTTYTLTGVHGTDGQHSRDATVRTVAGGPSNYQYVRFTPVKLRADGGANSVQIAEFWMLDGFDLVTPAAASAPDGDSPDAEGPENVFDNDVGTKWLDFAKSALVLDYGSPVTFDGYYFTTANDGYERDPVRWTIEGSNDGENWTMIENVTSFDFPTPFERQTPTQDIPLPGDSITPFASITGDTERLITGEPLLLTWTSASASTVQIDNGVGTVSASGSTTVTPTEDTTYTITASSAGGVEATATFSVDVVDPEITEISYDDFNSAGAELILLQDAEVVNDFDNIPAPADASRLRLNPDEAGSNGVAWFAKRVDTSSGFSTTFDMQFIDLAGSGGADGMAFMIQNAPGGTTSVPTTGHENGLSADALNIKFNSFINADEPSAAFIQIRNGTEVLATADLNDFPILLPLPGDDGADLTMSSGDTPPYEVRVDYTSGDLDVYFNAVAVLTDVDVDLPGIGATDSAGTAYVGFAARTGGVFESHDITSWHLAEGPPPEPPVPPVDLRITDFGFDFTTDELSLTWTSDETRSYRVTASEDAADWSTVIADGIAGAAGAGETSATVDFTQGDLQLFRVEEEE